MNWFEKVKRYYDRGIYNNEDVRIFVQTCKLTKEEYEIITGSKYFNE